MELIAPSSETFAGGVIMPNLQPPIEDVRALLDYKERIEEALDGHHFIPNMTVNFKNYTPQELQSLNEHLIGIKMYPKG
jgi:dihydroorotase